MSPVSFASCLFAKAFFSLWTWPEVCNKENYANMQTADNRVSLSMSDKLQQNLVLWVNINVLKDPIFPAKCNYPMKTLWISRNSIISPLFTAFYEKVQFLASCRKACFVGPSLCLEGDTNKTAMRWSQRGSHPLTVGVVSNLERYECVTSQRVGFKNCVLLNKALFLENIVRGSFCIIWDLKTAFCLTIQQFEIQVIFELLCFTTTGCSMSTRWHKCKGKKKCDRGSAVWN